MSDEDVQTAPDSGHLHDSAVVDTSSGAGGIGGAAAGGPPPVLTVEEQLREEIAQLKQRIERIQKGHKIQTERLYEENQMLIQDLLKAEGEIAALKASGATLTARGDGATPSTGGGILGDGGGGSGGGGRGKKAAADDVDPLLRAGAGDSGESMSLAMVAHDAALSSKVSSAQNLTCVQFSRQPRTASLLVVGGASRLVSLVQWRRSAVLATLELGGPVLCTSFRPASAAAAASAAGGGAAVCHDLVAVGAMDGSLTLVRVTSTLAGGNDVRSASLEVVQKIDLGGQASIGRGASRYIKFAKWSNCGTLLAVSLGQTVVV